MSDSEYAGVDFIWLLFKGLPAEVSVKAPSDKGEGLKNTVE